MDYPVLLRKKISLIYELNKGRAGQQRIADMGNAIRNLARTAETHARMSKNNAAWKIPVPDFCPVNVESIQRGKKLLQLWRDYYTKRTLIKPSTYGPFRRLEKSFNPTETLTPEKHRADWMHRRMTALHWVDGAAHSRALSFGFVATDYLESRAGKLYGETEFHLQNIPCEVRKLALAGKWDYSLRNCHYSILQQLAHRYGIKCPAVDEYVANIQDVRETLSQDLGLDIADVKMCLLSLIYGATASHKNEDAIPNTLGIDQALDLYQHPIFSELMEEVQVAGEAIIANAKRKKSKSGTAVINVMGKAVDAKEPWRAILAHLLQGIEARMLHTVIEVCREEILLLQHDGWTMERSLDFARIEAEIERETGLNMGIEAEFLDPWD